MNILVVDDVETNRKLLRVNLEAEGHTVFDVADGLLALEVLERSQIDAVISDVLMPRMDGFRLCQEVRKHPRLNSLPFIIYTSTYKSPGDRKLAELAGADKYIVKPAPIAVILAALADLTDIGKSRSIPVPSPDMEAEVIQEYNAALVRKLEERNVELEQRNQLVALSADVGVALTRGDTLREILQNCAEALVKNLDAAFARIWTLNEKESVLELQSSAGMYTHIDGPHGRVPLGKFKIGLIAQERKPHLTNSVIGDPRVPEQEWAKREGMVAFAGYPLIVDERLMGVVAMFARHELPAATLTVLASVADSIAMGIQRKQAEKALRASEAQLRLQAAALQASANSILITDKQGTIQWVNPAFVGLTGYAAEEAIGRTPRLLKSNLHDAAFYKNLWEVISSGKTWRSEFINQRKDGSLYYGEQTITPVFSETGTITHYIGIMSDATARKQAEESLKLFRALIDRSPDAIEVVDPESGRFLDVNEKGHTELGYSREEFLSLRVFDVDPLVDEAQFAKAVGQVRNSGFLTWNGIHRRKDGSTFPVEVSLTYVHFEKDYIVTVVRDITERQRSESALRASEERFRELAETIEEVFWITDPSKNQVLYVSPAYEKIWGRSCQSLYDDPMSWLTAIHPEDRERVRQAAKAKQASGTYDEEYRVARPDKSTRWIRDRAFPVRNDMGRIERIVGLARDITAQRQLEEQFRQSQKMEGIGQLAGGVAHDFNNILTVIQGHAALTLVKELPAEERQSINEIALAAERAASLTRQLLLFSRRQVIQLRDLDLNEVVTSLSKMLQRIMGEDVTLQLHLQPGHLMTRADAGMIDQVLMNLAVNARDAMPQGGRLLIETTKKTLDEEFARLHPDVAPGSYVCISVSDTGTGIPPEVLPKIFEPFFTTKEPGKGTGLGLATVFGIVKQHGGWLTVYSELGKGTNFQIYLPTVDVVADKDVPDSARLKPRGGTETILVAEDETAVRLLTRAILEWHGYRVLEAANGVEAQKVWRKQRESVALLLTDLVMPGGIRGQELARQLQRDNSRLKVIFTSGYSAEIAGREIGLRSGENFLQKPFSPDQLLGAIRQCLDG